MTTTAAQKEQAVVVLALSFELSAAKWKLAFSAGFGQQPRYRTARAGDLDAVWREIEAAKLRLKLARDVRVVSCYEAGREGFWLHRALVAQGIENVVVDSGSIEVNRRARRAKTDRLDAGKLVGMLLRYVGGDRRVWKVVRVPTVEQEDRRQLHREVKTAKADRRDVTNRIKGLLATEGLQVAEVAGLPQQLSTLRRWNGDALPQDLQERLQRDCEQWQHLDRRVRELEKKRRQRLRRASDPETLCARMLVQLSGIGVSGGWTLSTEFFGWRQFRNRREIGGLAGLTPTPYQSGAGGREQGICKAGNRWIRGIAIELAWAWVRFQPNSELTRWYQRRYAGGSRRMRKIGIVAVARKLLIELWKYLETGVPPAGATLKRNLAYV